MPGNIGAVDLAKLALCGAVLAHVEMGVKLHAQRRMQGVGHEKQPFQRSTPLRIAGGGKQRLRGGLGGVGIGQPHQDRARFENGALWGFQHRDQPRWVQRQIGRALLRGARAIDQAGAVGQAQFL